MPDNEQFKYDRDLDRWVDVLNNETDDQERPDGWDEQWSVITLPMCQCGNPEFIRDALYGYLDRVIAHHNGGEHAIRIGEANYLSDYLLAIMADNMGLTTHGGAVGGAWIEPAGKRWRLLVERDRANHPEDEDD